MKRFILLCLVLVMTITALAEGSLGSIDSYDVALKWIKQAYGYKEPDNIARALEGIEEVPTETFYRQYKTWMTGIKLIHEANYSRFELTDINAFNLRKLVEARTRLTAILDDRAFIAELKSRDLPLPEEIISYITGLFFEFEGKTAEAKDTHALVRNVFDAEERMLKLETELQDSVYREGKRLYEEGKYWQAYLKYKQLDEYYIPEDDLTFGYKLAADALEKHNLNHLWTEPGCTTPATCSECGEIGAPALGHDWQEATCTEPKTCNRCGATEGEPLGHEWKDATCTEAGICIRCKAVGTDPTGHKWKEATCTEPKTCTICGSTEGEPLGHNWQPATYERPETCSRCGLTRGEKLKPKIAAGDIVTYGKYPQTRSGTDNTPIEWLVLDVQDNKALLISKYGLDVKPYNTKDTSVTWETCTLRTWLNEDFINKAFTAQERQAILNTNVDNSRSQGYSGYDTNGGNNTQDKVFLLSYAEANKYLDVTWEYVNNYRSRTSPTAYAQEQGVVYTGSSYRTNEGADACVWWLRSPGNIRSYAAGVYYHGSLCRGPVSSTGNAVRPALWLDSDAIAESTLTIYDDGINNEKLLVTEDGSIAHNPIFSYSGAGEMIEYAGLQLPEAPDGYTVRWSVDELPVTVPIGVTDIYVVYEKIIQLKAGDSVTYGHYPQTSDGMDNTPIEWLVLEVQDDKALLISKYALDCKPYNTEFTNVTWETCTLRTWLNKEFINKAFTMQEQQAILTTTVDNSWSQGYSGWSRSMNDWNNTQDKVFLLSYAEANKYFGVKYRSETGANSNMKSRTSPTAYAKAQGVYTHSDYKTNEGADACYWWLRSRGDVWVQCCARAQ